MMLKFRRVVGSIIALAIFVILTPFWLFIALPYSRIRHAIKKTLGLKPSILWGPTPIINISHNRLADRELGYTSDCLVYRTYHITQSSLFDYNLEKYYQSRYLPLFVPFAVMIWATFKYDILQFFYNGGFLYYFPMWISKLEFPLWKLVGKKVILMAYGADVRLESVTRKLGKYNAYMDMTHEEVVNEINLSEKQVKGMIDWTMRWADVSISMGDMIEYTPGSKNDVFYWAINTADWKPVYNPQNPIVTIVHAPNHPKYKGTRLLMPAIERLRKEGYQIKFDLVRKMTNAEARKHYEMADIVAEQFIIGYHGFTAIESMALGKPVMCYIRKPAEYLPGWQECPIVNTPPEKIYDNLKMLLDNKELRQDIGRRGRQYVEKYWSLAKVGERFDAIYRSIW